jgi:ABC-type uncharacterized transport system permease subunit
VTTTLTKPQPADDDFLAALKPPSYQAPIAYGIIAVIGLLVFGILPASGQQTTFTFATDSDFFQIEPLTVPSKATALVLCLLALGLAVYSFICARARRKVGLWLPIVFSALIVVAFLIWAVAGKDLPLTVTGLLQGALFLSIPLVFGSMAGLVCERVGIINIAIEGQLLAGAFLGAVVATLANHPYAGLVAAPVAGALVGLLLAWFAISYRVDQIIVGVVLNVLVIGLTSYLFSTVLTDNSSSLNSPPRLPVIEIPLLSDIPIIGPVLFQQTLLVYLMFALVIGLQIMIFRSRWGLRMRACGEHPKAADTVGIRVNVTRLRNTVLGGAIAGLGGAFFTIASGLAFAKEMTGGQGFIALAAMILGRWSPRGAFIAALLFGFAASLQTRLGIIGTPIPSQFMLMTPYLATIFAVAGLVGRVRPPAAEGIPYVK